MTDLQIITGLKSKDDAVFRYLYATFGPKVIGIVIKNSGTRDDGEDLLQVVVMKVWENVCEGRYEDRGKFREYFFTTAYNTWLNILRGQKIKSVSSSEDIINWKKDESDDDALLNLVKEQKFAALEKALSALGDMCRYLLEEFHKNEKTSKDLAQIIGTTDNAMRVRLHECRNKLRLLTQKIFRSDEQ